MQKMQKHIFLHFCIVCKIRFGVLIKTILVKKLKKTTKNRKKSGFPTCENQIATCENQMPRVRIWLPSGQRNLAGGYQFPLPTNIKPYRTIQTGSIALHRPHRRTSPYITAPAFLSCENFYAGLCRDHRTQLIQMQIIIITHMVTWRRDMVWHGRSSDDCDDMAGHDDV